MREIKFRAKEKSSGTWFYGSSEITTKKWFFGDTGYVLPLSVFWHWVRYENLDTETVGQFIGRLDKVGEEIYEGDIVSVEKIYYPGQEREEIAGHYVSSITFRGGAYVFHDGYEYWVPCQACFRTEVIGNIWDNPKLLEG